MNRKHDADPSSSFLSNSSATSEGSRQRALATGDGRVTVVDVARGLAVVGVVFNHAVDGAITASLLASDSSLASVNSLLYIARMPTLAFLIGLFIPSGVARRGSLPYVVQRVVTSIYLYLLWFFLQGVVEVAASGLKNSVMEPSRLLIVWMPYGQLWFLPFLAVATSVAVFIRPWCSLPRAVVGAVASCALIIAFWGRNPSVLGFSGLALILFVFAGTLIGLRGVADHLARKSRAILIGTVGIAVLCFGGLTGIVPATFGQAHPSPREIFLSVIAASGGVIAFCAAGSLISSVPGLCKCTAFVGRRTLPIFLAHVTVVAGVRIFLAKVGVDEPSVVVSVAVVLGVVVPVAASEICRRSGWTAWLFAAPSHLQRIAQSTPAPRW